MLNFYYHLLFLLLFLSMKRNDDKLELANESDKTFNLSEKVTYKKVTFHKIISIKH
jgi:hypothetical protein